MTDSDLVYVWCKWKYVEDLQYDLKLAQTLVLLLDFLQILRKFFFYSGGGHPGGCLNLREPGFAKYNFFL